jgi:prophage regulatory protein
MATEPPDPRFDGFLRLKQVLRLLPISKSTWYSMMAKGLAPKPIRLGSGIALYREAEINAMIQTIATDPTIIRH